MDPYIALGAVTTLATAVLWGIDEAVKGRAQPTPRGPAALPSSAALPFVRPTRELRQHVMLLQGYRCANPFCNMDVRGGPHLDHIMPRFRGGTDSIHNLQWLCETCNLNKRDQEWPAFLREYAAGLGITDIETAWERWASVRRRLL